MPEFDVHIGQVVTRMGRLVVEADDASAAESKVLEALENGTCPVLTDSHASSPEILSVELCEEEPEAQQSDTGPNFLGLDLQGRPLKLGDKVIAYAQRYAEKSRDDSHGIPIVELDIAQPKPVSDVPLFRGTVAWDPHGLAYIANIDEMLILWDIVPAFVHLGGGAYAYEIIDPIIPPDA